MKQKTFLFVGFIFLLGLLAAVTYTAARHFADSEGTTAENSTLPLAMSDEEAITAGVQFEGAAELPDRPPDTWGVLLSENDGRYLVGSGPNSVSITEVDGQLRFAPHHEGPEVEVVAQRDTVFYEDITDVSVAAASGVSGDMSLQQKVRLVQRPPQMPMAANFLVWGQSRGERLIGDIILFRDEGYQ